MTGENKKTTYGGILAGLGAVFMIFPVTQPLGGILLASGLGYLGYNAQGGGNK